MLEFRGENLFTRIEAARSSDHSGEPIRLVIATHPDDPRSRAVPREMIGFRVDGMLLLPSVVRRATSRELIDILANPLNSFISPEE